MNLRPNRLLFVVPVLCFSATTPVWANAEWSMYNLAGIQALKQAKYAEAEKLFTDGLKVAEQSGSNKSHIAASLNNLAELYRAQGKYADAEPLYKRSIELDEKALGPNHPDVATLLGNYAALLRKTNRNAEAEKLEARQKAILPPEM